MPNTMINYRAATQNVFNPYQSQYGVNMPSMGAGNVISGLSGLASMVPYVGPLLGAGMNILGTVMQNRQQEEFYNEYMSPQARMAQMKAAGINPNAAAEGISGASAPQMNAAAPTGAFGSLGEQLGNSVNNALSAGLIQSQVNRNNSEASLFDSQNVGKQKENAWFDSMQQATLEGMLQHNRITKAQAQMFEEDAALHGMNAAQNLQQNIIRTGQMAQELENLGQDFLNKCAEYQNLLLMVGKTEAETAELWSRVGLNKAMIGEVNARIRNLDANTASQLADVDIKNIEREVMEIKLGFQKQAAAIGFDTESPVMQNYYRLAFSGDKDAANKLIGNAYDYAKGQYGAKGAQARSWISTATAALATVGGVAMMFVPGLQVPGAAVAGAGVVKLTSGRQSGSRYSYDGEDYSHISE